MPGQRRHLGDRVFYRSAGKRVAQQVSDLRRLGARRLGGRRRDHERDLAAFLAGIFIVLCEGQEIAAAVTEYPAACAARTSLNPGSDTSGVPASEIIATAPPSASALSSFGRAFAALAS